MQTTVSPFESAEGGRLTAHPRRRAAILTGAALIAGLALTTTAPAQAADSVADCKAIEDDDARLECFDRLTRTDPSIPASPESAPESPVDAAPEPDTADIEPPAPARSETAATEAAPPRAAEAPATPGAGNFGLERKREVTGPDRIVASIIGGFQGWGGYEKTVFELDNGQVWEQVSTDRFRYGGRDRKVEIRRAALGSFLLSPEGMNRSVRVRRVE